MLTPEQNDFYTRWLRKADSMHGQDIGDRIDKYVTLFINYNALYNIVPAKKAAETQTPRQNPGDRVSATSFMLDYLGANDLLQHLAQVGATPQIATLAAIIPQFNINLNKGVPQPNKDAKMVADLNSNNNHDKALALLNALYSIRCNIVHGEKELDQYQELLIEPATQLLREIISYVHSRL